MKNPKRAKIILTMCLTLLFVALGAPAVFAQPSPYAIVGGTPQIFFASNRVTAGNPTGDYEIWRMNDDGSGVTQLTSNTAMDWHPVANDDGTMLTFASNRTGGVQRIFTMNSDGTLQTQVTFNPTAFDGHPFPKPGSGISEIVFTRGYVGEADNELVVVNTTSGVETRLTTNVANDSHASWNAAGKVAFGSDEDGDWDIWTMNDNGTGRTKITANSFLDAAPSWNWDGSKIVFHSKELGSMDVYTMDADGGGRALVPNTNDPNFDGIPWYNSTSATQTIVYTSEGSGADWDSEIVKILSDGSGKTALTANAPPAEDLWVPYLALVGQDRGSSCDLKAENPANPNYINPGVESTIPTFVGLLAIAAGGLLFFRQRRRRSHQLA